MSNSNISSTPVFVRRTLTTHFAYSQPCIFLC